ncbi:MAG: efflux RND transporter periplasmic adaptor subunit [Candidatus Cryptobacteroides sp.]
MNRFSPILISFALAAFICGCGNGNGHEGHSHGDSHSTLTDGQTVHQHEGEHSHEEAGGHGKHEHEGHNHEGHVHEDGGHLLLTAYSQELEFFAETGGLVAGEDVSVLLHITDLQTFKPLEGAEVSAILEAGGKSIACTAEEEDTPAPGIYRFRVVPPTEGDGTLIFTAGSQGVSIPVRIFDCPDEASEYAELLEAKSSNGAAFPKEQSWSVEFATEEVRSEPFGQVIKATSRIQPSQDEVFTISALTDGIISIGGKALVEGREVGKGETLCTVKSSGTADENLATRYAKAEADYKLASNEYERKRALAAENIVTQSELQQAEADYNIAKAVFDNLKGNFDASGQSAKSPIEGFVTSVLVSNGQFVRAGDPIATVSRSRSLLVVAEIQPAYSKYLKDICGATFKEMNSGKVWTLEELGGRIVSYGKSVSPDSPLIPVTFSISNKAGFIPGAFLQTRIVTRSEVPVLTLPGSALIEEQGNYFVYRQLTPEYFEKTPVTIGASDGLRTEIKSGLKEGERAVSKGAMFVKLAQASGALDPHAGHNH